MDFSSNIAPIGLGLDLILKEPRAERIILKVSLFVIKSQKKL